jgi:DNA-binding response OmpR family regulator
MRLLVVEDSTRLRTTVSKALRRSGYVVDEASDGEDGLWQAQAHDYDGIILDVMLPKRSGLELLTDLRAKGKETPILLLTALSEVEDRVAGLRKGADDYLCKPFALEELLARVDALCRRGYGQHASITQVGDLRIDNDARTAERSGTVLNLTAREFRLLQILAIQAGRTLSRTQLEEHLYDDTTSPVSNVVDATVYQLRRKLQSAGTGSPLIHTRRGFGYVLEVRE